MNDRRPRLQSPFETVSELARWLNLSCRARSRGHITLMLATVLGIVAEPPVPQCAVACKPIITVKSAEVSGVEDMRRVWTALLSVSDVHCATTSGRFEIDFIREKENAPDLQFTQQFEWKPGSISVSVELWWDEYVQDFRIGFIAPCVCRDFRF
jgi:hypothetical protein